MLSSAETAVRAWNAASVRSGSSAPWKEEIAPLSAPSADSRVATSDAWRVSRDSTGVRSAATSCATSDGISRPEPIPIAWMRPLPLVLVVMGACAAQARTLSGTCPASSCSSAAMRTISSLGIWRTSSPLALL